MKRPPYHGLKPGTPNPVVCGRKFCAKCGRWRLAMDFDVQRSPGRPDRLRSWCRTCQRISLRRYPATKRQRELRREYQRIWQEVQRRRAGVPPRHWRFPRPLPQNDNGRFLDPSPLVAELAQWDGTQKALAAAAGVPPRAIYRIESGECRQVRLDTADRLALALGRSLAELWGTDD